MKERLLDILKSHGIVLDESGTPAIPESEFENVVDAIEKEMGAMVINGIDLERELKKKYDHSNR